MVVMHSSATPDVPSLCQPSCDYSSSPIRLKEVLAAERSASDRNARPVSIHNEFLAAQPVVPFRSTNVEVSGTVDVKLFRNVRAKPIYGGSAFREFE